MFVLGIELQNDFKLFQGLGVLFHFVINDTEAFVRLMEAGVGLERLLVLLDGWRVFLFEQVGIAEIFHDDRIFGVPGESRPVGSDRLGESSLLPVSHSQFIKKKGAIVLGFVPGRFEKGDDLIGLAALVEERRFFRQAIKWGQLLPRDSLGAYGAGEQEAEKEKGKEREIKIGEELLSFP